MVNSDPQLEAEGRITRIRTFVVFWKSEKPLDKEEFLAYARGKGKEQLPYRSYYDSPLLLVASVLSAKQMRLSDIYDETLRKMLVLSRGSEATLTQIRQYADAAIESLDPASLEKYLISTWYHEAGAIYATARNRVGAAHRILEEAIPVLSEVGLVAETQENGREFYTATDLLLKVTAQFLQ